MTGKVLGGLAALVLVIVALGFVLPDKAHIERSVVIKAPVEEVYALVSDLNEVDRWSPWAEQDPEMTSVITDSGVGQKQIWTSQKMGSGSQEIAALDPFSRVDYRLDFGKMGVAAAAMTLAPVADGAEVVWSFDSNMRNGVPLYIQPLSTYMGLFIDDMLGKDYEKGLANLKALAEA